MSITFMLAMLASISVGNMIFSLTRLRELIGILQVCRRLGRRCDLKRWVDFQRESLNLKCSGERNLVALKVKKLGQKGKSWQSSCMKA